MKYGTLKTIATLGLFMILGLASVKAQSGGAIEAKITFDFAAGETKLKAGDYTIKRIAKDTLLFRSADEKTSVLVLAPVSIQQTRNDAPERLVFHRFEGQYFLAEVWVNRNGEGRAVPGSKTEMRLAKSKGRPETVEVAARIR